MKRIIALDIDGTLTAELLHIPRQVIDLLSRLNREQWLISLLTGRTLSFAQPLLDQLNFPYVLALQNGADILSMPESKLLARNYLSAKLLPMLEKVYQGQLEDFIIYSGFEKGDFCYFRPKRFGKELLAYLQKLETCSSAPWQAVEEFAFSEWECFPLIKCFGKEKEMLSIASLLCTVEGITTSVIRDPICPSLYLNLITAKEANKGKALRFLRSHFSISSVIAAGDDRNDLSMLEEAHVRIVMENAPEEVKKIATLIAKPAAQLGIIDALEEAVALMS